MEFKISFKEVEKNVKKVLTFSLRSYIITLASRIERQNKASQEVKSIGDYPSGCGSAWLERLVWDQEVAGSNPFEHISFLGIRRHKDLGIGNRVACSLLWWV